MILVMLGTYNIAFPRPLQQIESFLEQHEFTEELVVQSGHTVFSSKYFKTVPFFPPEELEQLYDRARLIITHAGTGSILEAVKKGKKVIAVARLKKYNEHVDDHQLEILNEFARLNHVLSWDEQEDFGEVLRKAAQFTPVPFTSSNRGLVNFLIDYIEKL